VRFGHLRNQGPRRFFCTQHGQNGEPVPNRFLLLACNFSLPLVANSLSQFLEGLIPYHEFISCRQDRGTSCWKIRYRPKPCLLSSPLLSPPSLFSLCLLEQKTHGEETCFLLLGGQTAVVSYPIITKCPIGLMPGYVVVQLHCFHTQVAPKAKARGGGGGAALCRWTCILKRFRLRDTCGTPPPESDVWFFKYPCYLNYGMYRHNLDALSCRAANCLLKSAAGVIIVPSGCSPGGNFNSLFCPFCPFSGSFFLLESINKTSRKVFCA